MQRNLSMMSILLIMLLALTFSLSYAEGRAVFTNVYFTPHPVRVGEITRISINFTVTGGPVNLSATIEQTTPRRVGPAPPTIILGKFDPGERVVDVYRYTVPIIPPVRICFNIKIAGGELRNVCLKRGRDARGWFMDVESYGQWVEVAPAPSPAPSAEKPDLRIVGNLAIDGVLTIENIGRGTAYNVRAVKECFVEGSWVRSGGAFGETRMLGPGRSVPARIGKLGRSLGPCPSGTKKMRVVVDPGNEIDEMDENNNVIEASTLADLKIVDFLCRTYQINFIMFELSNTGVADAGPFIWDISVYDNGEWKSFIGEKISGLASGKHIKIKRDNIKEPLFTRGGGVRVRLRIDSLNEVPETNEDDNMSETIVIWR